MAYQSVAFIRYVLPSHFIANHVYLPTYNLQMRPYSDPCSIRHVCTTSARDSFMRTLDERRWPLLALPRETRLLARSPAYLPGICAAWVRWHGTLCAVFVRVCGTFSFFAPHGLLRQSSTLNFFSPSQHHALESNVWMKYHGINATNYCHFYLLNFIFFTFLTKGLPRQCIARSLWYILDLHASDMVHIYIMKNRRLLINFKNGIEVT